MVKPLGAMPVNGLEVPIEAYGVTGAATVSFGKATAFLPLIDASVNVTEW